MTQNLDLRHLRLKSHVPARHRGLSNNAEIIMWYRNIFAIALVASSAAWSGSSAFGQDASQQAAPIAKDQTAKSQPGKNQAVSSTKDKGKVPVGAATSADTPGASEHKPSTADANPFPEDISRKAEQDAQGTSAPDAPTPSANPGAAAPAGTKPATQNSDYGDLTPPAEPVQPPRNQLKLESPDGTIDAYDPKRATEDVRVGKFYLQTGNYRGAYERLKDATEFDHENVEAVFWLAEAAQKVNLPQEAAQNYQLYLTANPDGPNARAARKALGELAPSKKR
jgi:hypothetical protein